MNKIIEMNFRPPKGKTQAVWSVYFDHGMHYDEGVQHLVHHVYSYSNRRLALALLIGLWKELKLWLKNG